MWGVVAKSPPSAPPVTRLFPFCYTTLLNAIRAVNSTAPTTWRAVRCSAMLALVGLLLGTALFLGDAGDGDGRVLSVPYRSQLDGTPYAQANCGPTALAMVLAYYGIDT